MKQSFATIILAGGKGTRMGSSEKHKVCFEVLGVPVILRALETYNLCGSLLNIVVVGMEAESVMQTVNRRFPGIAFAFQEHPRGTGDAARKGADILERMRFDGEVLVVAGDKVIEPKVIRQLFAAHTKASADITLATARRPPSSSTGILLQSARGTLVGILEEADRRRLLAWAELTAAFRRKSSISGRALGQLLARHADEKTAAKLLRLLGKDRSPADNLTAAEFAARIPGLDREGLLRVGAAVIPAGEILTRFDQMNLSTYVFRASVMYDALHALKQRASGEEEYLTDVFEILAQRRKPARVVGCEVEDPRDLMAFNNPQELMAIEEVYRQKQGLAPVIAGRPAAVTIAPGEAWHQMLQHPSPAAQKQFRQWYGPEVPWPALRAVLQSFLQRHGGQRPAIIIRSPGRINLLGRHIDHQGGTVNVMAINREIFLVAAPRDDDQVTLANLNPHQFAEQTFRISDLVASLDWDDWQHVVDSPRLHRILEAARGDWANYIKAAILRLQEQFRDRRLRGLDLLVGGDIPMGAGLSSSSALVVAAAEAVTVFNRLPVNARRLVSLCGESEWFVGTRGGAADHAAIKLSRRGYVTRVGFFPFQLEDAAPFLPGHDLIVCHSGIFAGKSGQARQTFNEKVTAYHIGRIWCKMLRPDLASRIQHLRDINRDNLGIRQFELYQLLAQLPARLSRAKVQAAFGQMVAADRDRLERLFLSHDAPAGGYPVREVVLFGLSEMMRARRCLDLLKQKNAVELGRLMQISHEGDRVSRTKRRSATRPAVPRRPGPARIRPAATRGAAGDLANMPGAYGCSLPEIDRIVDLALTLPGVEGAQLAGAGLGGCVMVLAQKPHTEEVLACLREEGIHAEVFRPIAGACSLVLV